MRHPKPKRLRLRPLKPDGALPSLRQSLDVLVQSLPGASSVDDLFQSQHSDEVTPHHERTVEQLASLLLVGLLGPPRGFPFRFISHEMAPCTAGGHAWRAVADLNSYVVMCLPRLGDADRAALRVCMQCGHAWLPTTNATEPP